jgi:hypothetical protein
MKSVFHFPFNLQEFSESADLVSRVPSVLRA